MPFDLVESRGLRESLKCKLEILLWTAAVWLDLGYKYDICLTRRLFLLLCMCCKAITYATRQCIQLYFFGFCRSHGRLAFGWMVWWPVKIKNTTLPNLNQPEPNLVDYRAKLGGTIYPWPTPATAQLC